MSKSVLRLRVTDSVGIVLVMLAVLVPSPAWIDAVRTSPPHLRDELLLGGLLFRAGLAVLGVFCIVAGRMGWWQVARSETAAGKHALDRGGAVLLGMLGIAVLLRLYRLNQGLWLDEIDTLVNYARAPFGEIITTYRSQNQHFLYTLLAHTAFLCFGESAWSLRLPAVLFGVASIWALYLFAREVTDRTEALLSAALLTFSYHHVWFSQNARGYSGLLFWTILASWFLLRGLAKQQTRLWPFYAGAAVLGVYTHMNMIFVVAAHFFIYAWMLVTKRAQSWPDRWAPFFCGFCPTALFTFLLHAFTVPQILGPALADRSLVPTWKNPLWTLREIVAGFHLGFGKGLAVLPAVVVVGTGCLSYRRRQPLVIALLAIPVALGSMVTLALKHPLWPRFFLFAFGFGILVVVRGTIVLGETAGKLLRWPPGRARRFGIVLTVAMIAVSAASLAFAYRPKQDFVGARDFVSRAAEQGDAIVSVGVAAPVYKNYYAPDWNVADNLGQFNAIRRNSNRTWVLFTLPLHMESYHPDIFAAINREFDLVRAFPGSLGGGTVFVYRFNGFSNRL